MTNPRSNEDRIGEVTETTTESETTVDVIAPTIPAVADLFTPRQRAIIYLLSVMAAAAYGIIVTNANLHWGFNAGYAAWNAFVGLVAVSNVPRPPANS